MLSSPISSWCDRVLPETIVRTLRARLGIGSLLVLGVLLVPAGVAHAVTDSVATYRIRMSPDSRSLTVSATLPLAGGRLRMETTRPAGVPELDSLGWAGLVRELRVSDRAGRRVEVAQDGDRGWTLPRPDTTTLTLEYKVDYGPLEQMGWPAPREAAYRSEESFVLVGRSLFITTEATGECRVAFELPDGWSATTPWRADAGKANFAAGTVEDLVKNLIVLSRGFHDEVVAGGFRLHLFAFGHWAAVRAEVRRVLHPIVRHHVSLMNDRGRANYVIVLLPGLERGGESYRSSFALNTDTPDPSGIPTWANLVAHEMFHVWNGWRLRGADYASSQWFQEGFTEYVANRAIATSGIVTEDWFRSRLARHVENSRRLATTLENIGTRKGPPLYSAGALVAFTWDVRIRRATGGKRDLGDFFRELMRRTDGGAREYAWPDLRAALEATTQGDWQGYYDAHIRGHRPLPVAEALAAVGQRMVDESDSVRVEADPTASAAARRRWSELVSRR